MMKESINRGDIYIYDFGESKGSIERGNRPALVLQDQRINSNSPTTIVAAISSVAKKMNMPSHIWLGSDYGLRMDSIVLLEQVRTVEKADLGPYVGTVDDEHTLKRIESGLKKQFGLVNYRKERKDDIRCLCPKCAADYRVGDRYIVKRLDPYNDIKEECMKCGRPGYDYVIFERM